MNRLSTEDRTRAVACLVEGNSQRATCRMTGLAKKTVSRLAVELGEACERFADNIMRDLPCTQIQCDEIWSFCYAKAKNVPQHLKGSGAGDVWTWVAIDPDTKLIPAWYIGDRTAQSAYPFMRSVAKRLKNRVKLSTDGHRAYLIAVQAAFHLQPIDFGMLRKIYGENTLEGKYSPGECIGTERTIISGNIRKSEICTSHAERQNLTMRMRESPPRVRSAFRSLQLLPDTLLVANNSRYGRWPERARLGDFGFGRTLNRRGGRPCRVSRSALATTPCAI